MVKQSDSGTWPGHQETSTYCDEIFKVYSEFGLLSHNIVPISALEHFISAWSKGKTALFWPTNTTNSHNLFFQGLLLKHKAQPYLAEDIFLKNNSILQLYMPTTTL